MLIKNILRKCAQASYPLLPSLHVPVVAIGHSSSSVSSGCTMHKGQVGEGVEGEGTYSIGDVVGDRVSAGRTCRGVGDSVLSVSTESKDKAKMCEIWQVEL